MSGRAPGLLLLAWLALAAQLSPASALAQLSFSEELRRQETEHFTFVYRERFAGSIAETLAVAEQARARIIADLAVPRERAPRAEVRFARNVEEMRRLCPRPPPGWADAVAFSPEDVIVISLTSSGHRPVTIETVFRHELAHLALRWAVGDAQVPRWFNEGLAIVTSGEQPFERFQALVSVATRGQVTPLRQLDRRFPEREFAVNQAYAESADFVRFLSRHRGDWRFRELLTRLRQGEVFPSAVEATWGASLTELERAWHEDLQERFSIAPTMTAGLTLWAAVGLMAVYAYIKRRREVRRRIEAMSDDDEDEEDDEPELRPASPPAEEPPPGE